MKVLVTGATGFVGSRIVDVLDSGDRYIPIAAVRGKNNQLDSKIHSVLVDSLDADNSWESALKDIEVVIHTAARVHVMSDDAKDPLSEYRKVNVEGTLNLACHAADAGVKRFIFLSSIKVNGEGTKAGQAFTESDAPKPVDPYGISKFETEIGLYKLADETGMEIVCIRPPLVYGPGVKANFLNMMCWLKRGVPLPFGAIHNKRSLVALDNLVDLIVTCIEHPNASNQTFLAGDGDDLSTTELLQGVARVMNKTAVLLPIHEKLLELGLKLVGKSSLAQRLCGSLQVDTSKARNLLNWAPPVSVKDGLQKTVKNFLDANA